jgi:hypothetical protein
MDNTNGFAGESAADPTQRVKDAASTVVERGKDVANEALAKGSERASSFADTTASALRRVADDVEGDNRMIGTALRKSADTIERAAKSLEGGDLSRTVEDLNGFARRQPALFLGASLALGFALARVGKTAIEQAGETTALSADASVSGA